MKSVLISIDGIDLDFETAKQMTKAIAAASNPDTDLLAWHDKKLNRQSPTIAHCDSDEFKGWEEYGRHHGARYEIRINSGEYVMIYS